MKEFYNLTDFIFFIWHIHCFDQEGSLLFQYVWISTDNVTFA
jgi:hypothetical protein